MSVADASSSICLQCEEKFNEFDELQEELIRRKNVLRKMIEDSRKVYEIKIEAIEIKPEVVYEEESVNDVEVKGEANYITYDSDANNFDRDLDQDEESFFENDQLYLEEMLPLLQRQPAQQKPKKLVKPKKVKVETVYECPICLKHFHNSSNLSKHKETHSEVRKYICPTCGKGYKTADYLSDHKKIHLNLKPFTCDLCGLQFREERAIRGHIARIHSTLKNFLCNLCPKTYATAALLRKHIDSHDEEKPLSCTFCEAKFRFKYRLDRHIRTHSDKSIPCPHCHLKFRENYCLIAHFKRVHSGIKQKEEPKFACSVCDKKYSRRGLLHKHMTKAHELASDKEDDDMNFPV